MSSSSGKTQMCLEVKEPRIDNNDNYYYNDKHIGILRQRSKLTNLCLSTVSRTAWALSKNFVMAFFMHGAITLYKVTKW